MFLDMNGFKKINDSHGHQAGDLALKEFANRISGCLRADDTVARLGGDEFAVIAEGVHTIEQGQALAKKIVATLDAPLAGTAILIATSIGINLYTASVDAEQFLREADMAMYEAKKNSSDRNKIAVYGG
jgi:diguanylate cyclase (GGDEF)-like protein